MPKNDPHPLRPARLGGLVRGVGVGLVVAAMSDETYVEWIEMSGQTYETPNKPWFRSRTIWLNAIGVAVLIVGIVLDNAKLLELPDRWGAYLTVVMAILNALNRFLVVQPIDGSRSLTTTCLELVNPDGTAKKTG